jgi:hypothetical protein
MRQRKFLKFYELFPSISVAARRAQISKRHVYRWKRLSPWFRAQCNRAEAEALDNVDGTIFERGLESERDQLLMFIAKHRIAAYQPKPKEVTVTNRGGVPTSMSVDIENVQISASALTDEEIVTMKRILAKMGAAELTDLFLNPAPEDLMDVPAVPAVEP